MLLDASTVGAIIQPTMCARYGIEFSHTKLTLRIGGVTHELPFREVIRTDIRPTNTMPVVRSVEDGPEVTEMRWGFLPKWMKSGRPLINARDDKLRSSGFWKPALESRRCLVPATYFFEWQEVPGRSRKQKMKIHPTDQNLFYMAGLWGPFQDEEGKDVDCYTIITTEPNAIMRPIHNRMPVVLGKDGQGRWLQGDDLDALLKPYEGPMEAEAVE